MYLLLYTHHRGCRQKYSFLKNNSVMKYDKVTETEGKTRVGVEREFQCHKLYFTPCCSVSDQRFLRISSFVALPHEHDFISGVNIRIPRNCDLGSRGYTASCTPFLTVCGRLVGHKYTDMFICKK